jgi:hypothetical protein
MSTNVIDPLEPRVDENGQIIDFVTGDVLSDGPEERVRQRLQRLLHIQYGYAKNRIAREIPIYYGSRPATDREGNPIRADVGVFRTAQAARKKDQGKVHLIAETKRPNKEEGYAQLVSYVFNTSANGAIWFNGGDFRVWRRVENNLDEWPSLPQAQEEWDAVGRRTKTQLLALKDPRGTLGTMIDPAGGSGGFCSAVLRRVRHLIREQVKGRAAQERSIEHRSGVLNS